MAGRVILSNQIPINLFSAKSWVVNPLQLLSFCYAVVTVPKLGQNLSTLSKRYSLQVFLEHAQDTGMWALLWSGFVFPCSLPPVCLCQSKEEREGTGNSPSCQQTHFASQDAAWAEDKEKLHPFLFVLAPQLEALGKHWARPQQLIWLTFCISPSMRICGSMLCRVFPPSPNTNQSLQPCWYWGTLTNPFMSLQFLHPQKGKCFKN